MKIVNSYKEIKKPLKDPVITIGNFDGVHLGHSEILTALIHERSRINGTAIVYTFTPHPEQVLRPSKFPGLITPNTIKFPILANHGVDVIINEKFSKKFAKLSRDYFTENILNNHLKIKSIVVGYDFGFGKDIKGDAEYLAQYCQQNGISVVRVAPKILDKETISSTLIRNCIALSEFSRVSKYLGRNYCFSGKVIRGNGFGTKIEVPTANISIDGFVVPKYGVYAGIALLGDIRYKAISYIGKRPTLDNGIPILEIHIFDFSENIYNKNIEFYFYKFIRGDKKFSNLAQLSEGIKKDILETKLVLKNLVK